MQLFFNQTALVLKKTKNDTLEIVQSLTTFTIKSSPLECYVFFICLDPDFLCPGLYWPCFFRQHPHARMTIQQQRKRTEVQRATGTSHVFEVTDVPPRVLSSFSDVWFLLLYPLVLFSNCLLLLSRDGMGI